MELGPCQDLLNSRAPSCCRLKDIAQEDHRRCLPSQRFLLPFLFLRIRIRRPLWSGWQVTGWLMAFSKVCWQIPPCLEPYWSQKFAHCSGRLCGQEEMVSHGPATPVTHLFSWRGERKWSLCGIIKPRKTLKIPLNFHTLLAAEMYDLLGGEKKPPAGLFFPPIALTSEAT